MKFKSEIFTLTTCVLLSNAAVSQVEQSLTINQQLWGEFSQAERATLLVKFPQLELIPMESVGIVQSVQAVNRSTAASNSGTVLGSAVGQAMYIDKAFSGSSNNYSATTHLGVGLLGAFIGSSLNTSAKTRFIFNYGIRTLDGQIREVRIESSDEFTRPIGQCVTLPDVIPAPMNVCAMDKVQFLKKLSAIATAPEGSVISDELTGINVKCRVSGVGLMTLERNSCLQMEGSIEK